MTQQIDWTFRPGEGLAGDGNEIAHVDVLIGKNDGPVGVAFATGLVSPSEGHTTLYAVSTPNVLTKPATLLVNKVTIKGAGHAVQHFGPAQEWIGRAVLESVEDGVIPKDVADSLVVIVSVFIHWQAASNEKIAAYNYVATKMAIKNAVEGSPTVDEAIAKKDSKHPFGSGAESWNQEEFDKAVAAAKAA